MTSQPARKNSRSSSKLRVQSRRVALLIESSRAYGRSLLLGIAKYVRQHRAWSVQSEEWRWTDGPPAWLTKWDGDGVIARIETRELATSVRRLGIPVVDLRGSMAGCDLPLIDTDDKEVSHLAAAHLMDRGFRHFAFCGFVGANYSDTRCLWFVESLARAGFRCSVYQPSKARKSMQTVAHEKRGLLDQHDMARWLAALPKPVGIMACNDIRGQQVMNMCRRTGLVVPEEVGVIGVDNDEVLCELSDPPLTSVAPDTVRIGYDAAVLLEQLMAGCKLQDKPVFVPPKGIVVRRSTEVLAMDDRQLAAGIRFIREHAVDPITINDAARAAGMSRRAFERRFISTIGRPPKAEVIRLRLERAKELLTESDWTLSEIAEKTGFNHGEYLHTVFTQKLGMTPAKFRTSLRLIDTDLPLFLGLGRKF